MEFSNVIKERYSVRKYKPDMIWDDELNRILEAGMLAPTGCNYQPQRIYVLKSDEAIAKIRSLSRCAFDAPVVLLIVFDETADWKSPLEAGCRAGIYERLGYKQRDGEVFKSWKFDCTRMIKRINV